MLVDVLNDSSHQLRSGIKSGREQETPTVRIIEDFKEAESLQPAWDEFVARQCGNIYMSYDWCRLWWQFYGKGDQLRVFLFFVGEDIVGILPFYIQDLTIGLVRFRVARLVGANIPPKLFEPPVLADYAVNVFGMLLHQLLGNDRCDMVSLGPLSEKDESGIALLAAANRAGSLAGGSEQVQHGVHTVFNLPESYEKYLETLSKNEKKNRRKYELRLLSKEFETSLDVLSDPLKTGAEFDSFAAQHAVQWRAEGKPGHFGAWPNALEYNRALVKAHSAHGRVRFIRIVANGNVISNQYTFAFGDRYVWELPSRVVGAEWERFSLGRTGVATMIKAAIDEKKTRLEGGLGHYDYKLRLNAEEHPANVFRVLNARAGTPMRYRLFLLSKRLVGFGYQKIWYRRVQPHLGSSFQRPQAASWLRLEA